MKRLLIAVCLCLALPVAALAQMTATRVAQGELSGVRSGAVEAFLGVPFAAPPVGDNRWRAPKPAASWTGVRQADHFAASCMQPSTPDGFGPWTHEYEVSGPLSEDCLYANIWTAAKSRGARLPVMVWIYGGGFNSGSGSVPIYDGAALAARGIVVVNVNYRVGLYGFLSHPGLTAEAGTSGNYGLRDQIAALTWVRDNISAFGGDPARVTIAGQSAGAASVHDLMHSPLARGLFIRAIAESGSGMGKPPAPLSEGEAIGVALQKTTGASSLADLRRLDVTALNAAAATLGAKGLYFNPVRDGVVVGAATQSDVPLLTGLTANEVQPPATPVTAEALATELKTTFGPLAGEAAALYPAATDAEAGTAREAFLRDRGLAALYLWARDRDAHAAIHAYLWTHVEPGHEAARYKAFHASDVPYVFGVFTPDRPFTAADHALSDVVERYWVDWVKTGDPNGSGLVTWPAFTASTRQIEDLGDDIHAQPLLDDKRLDLFVRHAANGGGVTLF